MFGKKGSSAAGSGLVVLLTGLALMLGAPQAVMAAEQTPGAALLARGAGYGTAGGSGPVETLQRRLQALGESPGPVDGIFGPLTEGAVTRLQLRSGLAADGVVGPATRKALRTAQPRPLRRGAGYGVPGGSAQVKTLQRRLRAAGQRVGPIDGKFGPQTELAVNSLQGKSDLVVDGVAGPQTYAALDRLRDDGSRNVQDEEKAKTDETERRGSASAPTEERPRAKRPAATPASGDGGGSDVPWLPIAIGLGVLGLAGVLFLLRDRLPRRKPPTTVVPLGRGLELEGESGDPEIGRFRGTAYAVEMPDVKDPGERAAGSRFFVLDPKHRLPFWVEYSEVETPLPPALQAHPGPWVGQRGLRPGTRVLGYVTVPRSVPERQAELYEQLAPHRGALQATQVRAPRRGAGRRAERRRRARAPRREVRAGAVRVAGGERARGLRREPARRLAPAARHAARAAGRQGRGARGARARARHLDRGGARAGAPARDRPQRAREARRAQGLPGRRAPWPARIVEPARPGGVAAGDRRCAQPGPGGAAGRVQVAPAQRPDGARAER